MQRLNPHIAETIKGMAIRGRFALALTAVERGLRRFGVHDARVDAWVDLLWGFVEMPDLGTWEESIRLAPFTDATDALYRGSPVPESFARVPEWLLRALMDVEEIGRSHLYGAIPPPSHETLELTLRVLSACEEHSVELPPLAPFARLSFSELHGWGGERSRSWFG